MNKGQPFVPLHDHVGADKGPRDKQRASRHLQLSPKLYVPGNGRNGRNGRNGGSELATLKID